MVACRVPWFVLPTLFGCPYIWHPPVDPPPVSDTADTADTGVAVDTERGAVAWLYGTCDGGAP